VELPVDQLAHPVRVSVLQARNQVGREVRFVFGEAALIPSHSMGLTKTPHIL
jgi:hypothetical protein